MNTAPELAHDRDLAIAPGHVAVLIPVYGDDGRLADTLASLAGQGTPCTAVVVDDGSTPPIAVDADRCPVPVVVLRQQANGGIERALNAGLDYIARLGFTYVARLDNGDRCAPGRLATQIAYLEHHPDVGLVGSDVEWRTEAGELAFRLRLPRTHDAIVRAMHHTTCLIHPTVTFRSEILDVVGAYSYAYPAAEDLDFFWRISQRYRVGNIPEVLLVTRLDANGISARRRRRQLRTTLRLRLRHFDRREAWSYVGVLKCLVLLAAPTSVVASIKRALWGRG